MKKKSTGRARPDATAPAVRRASPKARPVPEDFDVGVGPVEPVKTKPEFDVGTGIRFTPPDNTGLSKDHYPLSAARHGWNCPYGCPGSLAILPEIEAHSWNCPWWENEGAELTPFELPAHGGGAAKRNEPPRRVEGW